MVIVIIIIGIGVGSVFQPTLVALQAHCTKPQRAIVISVRNFLRSLGGAFGLAMAAAVLQSSLKHNLPEEFKYIAASTYSKPDLARFTASQKMMILDAYAAASRAVFIMQVPFIAVCLGGCFFVKDNGLTRPDETQERRRITAGQQRPDHHPLELDRNKEKSSEKDEVSSGQETNVGAQGQDDGLQDRQTESRTEIDTNAMQKSTSIRSSDGPHDGA
jgi:hypothetical protein